MQDRIRASNCGGVKGLLRKSVAPNSKLVEMLASSLLAVRIITGSARVAARDRSARSVSSPSDCSTILPSRGIEP